MRTTPVYTALLGLALSGLALSIPTAANAQSDFLLKRPALTFSVFGGWDAPGESSDLFDFVREELTLERGDFSSPVGMAEVAVRLTERFDVALGVEHASRTVASEMREWVTQDDQPIPQTTDFSRTRFLASGKAYLFPRGRAISQFAWVPYRWSPYIGGGAGITRYGFEQAGDFVDYQTLDIFETRLEAEGSALTTHALAGAQLSLSPRFLLRAEYRYIWGSADVEGHDFSGFDAIDLSGSRALLGVAVRM